MKRSIKLGSIFRPKENQATPPPSEQADQTLLVQRIAGRSLTLKEGALSPLSSTSPPLDWERVNGQILVPASGIEGLLEGRARIRAHQLKQLSPSPVDSETPDTSEYDVSLSAVVPQIQDLLGQSQPEIGEEPEYETPFTVLARQDGARFAKSSNQQQKQELPLGVQAGIDPPRLTGTAGSPSEIPAPKDRLETLSDVRMPSSVALPQENQLLRTQSVTDDVQDHVIIHDEMKRTESEPTDRDASGALSPGTAAPEQKAADAGRIQRIQREGSRIKIGYLPLRMRVKF
jgi:hypothetical protein